MKSSCCRWEQDGSHCGQHSNIAMGIIPCNNFSCYIHGIFFFPRRITLELTEEMVVFSSGQSAVRNSNTASGENLKLFLQRFPDLCYHP